LTTTNPPNLNLTQSEWSLIPLTKRSKIASITNWQTIKYSREKLKTHDGNIGLVCGNISGGIIVFDWDFKKGFNRNENGFKEIYKLYQTKFPELSKTRICKTPNGYHFYYVIKDSELKNTSNKNGGYRDNGFVGKNKTKFTKWLEGIDTRANNGYVVIPPSIVDKKKYEWLLNYDPKEITLKEYEQINAFFIEKESQLNTMRKGFIDILTGKVNIHDLENNEHVYWKEMFHEAYCCCGLLPEDLLDGLEKFQPAFNREKTVHQINNQANRDYILNDKRLSSEKYQEYFSNIVGFEQIKKDLIESKPKKETVVIEHEPKESELYLEGYGYVFPNHDGILLEKDNKRRDLYKIFEGSIKLEKLCYETLNNNRTLLTGSFNNNIFRTLPLSDLLIKMNDSIMHGTMGKDCVKYWIHKECKKLPIYNLAYVLGFNTHWNLPILEEPNKLQILTATDKQIEAYCRAKDMIAVYDLETITTIKNLMKNFINLTKMNSIKLSIVIGWSMAAPFRHVFIDYINLFPMLCAYGNRNTGKSTVLQYFVVKFYGIYENYDGPKVLGSATRFEDVLSTSSFPIFIQEVSDIPPEIVGLVKEHLTGSSKYFRKRSARENDFNCIKSAAIAFDCNTLPEHFLDPAVNTKTTLIPFTDKETIKIDLSWGKVKNELEKYKLFSLYYNYTKDWTEKDIQIRIDKYNDEIIKIMQDELGIIEKDYPRLVQQYVVIAFGIDLFNEIFETNFDRKTIIDVLVKSRTVMMGMILNDFYAFCNEAINFDIENKNPQYLSHKLEEYESKKGRGYFFDAKNKSDFQKFILEKKPIAFSDLLIKLKDALDERQKEYITEHNTGKKRGIFIKQAFFDEQTKIEIVKENEIENKINKEDPLKYLKDIKEIKDKIKKGDL